MNEDLLRELVDARGQVQKGRIQWGNRAGAVESGDDNAGGARLATIKKWHNIFLELEGELDRDIAGIVQGFQIYEYVTAVKGLGPMLAAKLISMIDISRAPTISSLWRYAGYGVTNGSADRLRKGEKSPFNRQLKTACYLVAQSMLKSHSPYRAIYDDAKATYEVQRPEWSKLRRHRASLRKMIKIFLAHLWLTWRKLEGLGISEPYVQARLGHVHIIMPEEMGWPAVY